MKKKINALIISFIFSLVLWVSISLSNDFYATVDIPVRVVDFPEGFTLGTKLPETVSIKLKGDGWKLISVNLGAESDFIVSAGTDSGKKTINLYNYLAENQWLSSGIEIIDITPDTLTFDVEKISEAKVKIIPNLNVSFKPGYGLASGVAVFPESTTVFGPFSNIENLRVIPTEPLVLNDVDEKISEQIKLEEITGMVYETNTVNVVLDVQKIVDKNLSDISVEVLDLPHDRNVVLLPNKINIGVRGGIDLLGKLDEKDVRAYVFYRDVVLDTLGSVIPTIELPKNISQLYIKPERLRYIIKKF